MEIKKLNSDQWQKYRDFRARALRTDPKAFGRSYEEELLITEEEWLRKLPNMFFAIDGEKIIGMIGIRKQKGQLLEHVAILFSVYVDPDYRNKGIGKALMVHVIDILKGDPGVLKIRLSVNEMQEEALKMYEKLGFQRTGYTRYEIKQGDTLLNQIQMELIFEDKIK